MAATLVQQEFFGSSEQAEIGEAMNWNEFEVIGRMAYLWNGSQRRKLAVVSAKQIGSWCKIADIEERTKLIDILCSESVGLLKRRRLDSFEIIGNKKQVKKLKQLSALRSAGGKTTRAKFPTKSPTLAKQNIDSNQEQDAEVKLDAIPRIAIPRIAIQCNSSPINAPEHDPNQESFALGGSGAGSDFTSLDMAIAAAEKNGRWTEAEQLRSLKTQFRALDENKVSA